MTSSVVTAFCDSLAKHNATSSVVEASAFRSELETVLTGPSVGVSLPFEGVSLADSPVTLDPTPSELENASFGVTPAELGIADYGSVSVRSDSAGTELVSLFAETHVAIVAASDVEPDAPTAFEVLDTAASAERPSVVLATGPSATADMGDLVYGAHGPTNVHVIVLSDR